MNERFNQTQFWNKKKVDVNSLTPDNLLVRWISIFMTLRGEPAAVMSRKEKKLQKKLSKDDAPFCLLFTTR